MKKKYINFTYSKDGLKTIRAVRSLRKLDSVSDIIILDDANDPMSSENINELMRLGCFVRPTIPKRHGNLRGYEFNLFMIYEFLTASSTCDVVIKFDSDVVFKDDSWVDTFFNSGMPLGGIRSHSFSGIWGACYALRSDSILAISRQYEKGIPSFYKTEEDYELSNRTCLAFDKEPIECIFTMSYEDAGTPYSNFIQVHETKN